MVGISALPGKHWCSLGFGGFVPDSGESGILCVAIARRKPGNGRGEHGHQRRLAGLAVWDDPGLVAYRNSAIKGEHFPLTRISIFAKIPIAESGFSDRNSCFWVSVIASKGLGLRDPGPFALLIPRQYLLFVAYSPTKNTQKPLPDCSPGNDELVRTMENPMRRSLSAAPGNSRCPSSLHHGSLPLRGSFCSGDFPEGLSNNPLENSNLSAKRGSVQLGGPYRGLCIRGFRWISLWIAQSRKGLFP